ncbi:hypothetical protein A3C18_00615 [Candidatus Kaiserbacteria bacterium RIFCSPHIGHO2_02_FULL_54_11b]|uniref:Uncharacterized protein n=2 Tax=Candidatus Kaiseribacteriota TaxID=1752734 RepID=A0A1F6CMA1_9BACT|nr:MAG: hypothetical protein A2704_05500 [Candidatus Kaiserbacteria bacterium RIFCSPHIGHO2_01_FULL_54_36b]OGG64747.1 MAG: hypothetical protein A3C18_00615 [Candidatus Kaiserbacteria bacterium RIFCSPHIGHO2_02_FULL_54_11b]
MREHPAPIPSERLRQHILTRISREERRRARIYVFASAATILLSIVGIVVSVQYMLQAMRLSSSSEYLSLILSDADIVFANWQVFALSLLESIPLLPILMSLIASFTLLVAIRTFANNLRTGLVPSFGN